MWMWDEIFCWWNHTGYLDSKGQLMKLNLNLRGFPWILSPFTGQISVNSKKSCTSGFYFTSPNSDII